MFLGVICAARDTTSGDLVAIKFEKADPNRQILRTEVSALKKLQDGMPLAQFEFLSELESFYLAHLTLVLFIMSFNVFSVCTVFV